MNILLIFPGFILAFIVVLCYEYTIKNIYKTIKNDVHFYMARDKDWELYLYLGKPLRNYDEFIGDINKGSIVLTGYHFNKFGLNKNDYAKLKWEDEPIEVSVHM